jgi:hypothetical protein
MGAVTMLKNLLNINTSILEFMLKFPLALFVIMPASMGGFFWLGVQIDTMLNIHFLKFLLPFIGTGVGIYLTGLLIMAGHTKQSRGGASS